MDFRPGMVIGLLFAPVMLNAQDIPPYVPANPILESRSALYAQPYISSAAGWQFRVVSDYYNAVEVSQSPAPLPRQYLFDAEVLQADVWATHDLSRDWFVLADVPVRGAYNGFLDGFLNWYHRAIGLSVPARNDRPLNTFDWSFVLPDSNVNRQQPGTFLGDVRAGVGWRAGRFELIGSVTAPTATVSADGWSRHEVGTSLSATGALVHGARVELDASASVGYTPVQGPLAFYQHSVFASGFVSGRWQFAGRQSAFFGAWYQSDNWHDTGFDALDDAEVTADFGFLLHLRQQWPELQLGMTQDLKPAGPAMDVGFSVGLRWGSRP